MKEGKLGVLRCDTMVFGDPAAFMFVVEIEQVYWKWRYLPTSVHGVMSRRAAFLYRVFGLWCV